MLSFAEKPVLTGDLVTLRPVQPADAAGLFAMDDETARLTGSLANTDPAWTLEYLEQWYASRAQHDDRIDLQPRARHVYEKVGFVHEGTMRDALRWNGAWVDCHLMAMLPTDRKPPHRT
jgi:hypothetical protein